MNKVIEITIRNKVARIASSPIIVGKNKDYIVRFDFDEDWDKYDTKTARFSQDGEYQDIIFAGNECPMPALDGGKVVEVGVYAGGDISTTTPAYLKVQKSIIDDDGVPADPTPDVYAQLMERLNELEAPAAVLYTEQNLTDEQKAQARDNIGVTETGSDADISLGIRGASAGQVPAVRAVDENGVPTEWEAADKMEASNADWNQNDDTKSDYVQNRTHYEESTYTDYVLNMSGIEIAGFSLPEVGDTVTVKINGVDSAETVKVAEFNSVTYKYIGNIDLGSLLNGGSGWCTPELQGHVGGYAKPDTTITVETIVVHKINEKFINFDGFVRTFDYHFKDPTIYKTLYRDNGDSCLLYMCNSFILPESGSQLFGFMSETGFSRVGDTGVNSCIVTGFIISDIGSITIKNVVLGTNATEMEQIAAANGYTLTTNPNA